MYRLIVLVFVLALSLTSVIPSTQAQATNCTASVTSLADPLTRGVWDRINSERSANGKPAYEWSEDLARAAAWMAQDRATRRATNTSDLDSLGRYARERATDCGYRGDAQVSESAGRMWTRDPFNVWNLWKGGDPQRTYWAVRYSTQYPPNHTVAALGRVFDAATGADFWVLNMGTQPDASGPVPSSTPSLPTQTSVPPTATQVPPSPTLRPTSIATQTPVPEGPDSITFSCPGRRLVVEQNGTELRAWCE
jgi:hypothetical protein